MQVEPPNGEVTPENLLAVKVTVLTSSVLARKKPISMLVSSTSRCDAVRISTFGFGWRRPERALPILAKC